MSKTSAKDDARAFLDGLLAGDDVAERVDWPRWRLMQLMQGTAGSDPETREQLLARGFVELARGNFGPDDAARSLRSLRSLIEILLPRGWRFFGDYENPMVMGLISGPAKGTPPNLTRYLKMLQEIASQAAAVTIAARDDDEGKKLMTLLLVGGKYVGFLPGSAMSGGKAAR